MSGSRSQVKRAMPDRDMPDEALLSPRQVAALAGVSLITLSRWRSARSGPPFIRLSQSRSAYPAGSYRKWVRSELAENGFDPDGA